MSTWDRLMAAAEAELSCGIPDCPCGGGSVWDEQEFVIEKLCEELRARHDRASRRSCDAVGVALMKIADLLDEIDPEGTSQ